MPKWAHGHKKHSQGSPTYNSWASMKQRCLNPKDSYWHRYGGRGIQICPTWLKFENFLRDMGVRPEGKTLDRIENDLHYMPGNCQWATPEEQRRNQSAQNPVAEAQ